MGGLVPQTPRSPKVAPRQSMLLHVLKLALSYNLLIAGRLEPQKAIDLTHDCLTSHARKSPSPASCTALLPVGAVEVVLELRSSVDAKQLAARWTFGGVVGETRGVERRSHDEGSGERLVRFSGLQVSAVMSHTVELAYFPAGFTSASSSKVCGADPQARGECAIELQLGVGSAISLEDAVRAG